ncbi:hypothetical protein Trydic_g21138 [Trypoxylus dichotomus]
MTCLNKEPHHLDLEEAFDKTRHEELLLKIEDARTQKTIRSYLQNKRFHTAADGSDSFASYMKSGMPQGSLLSPVLFIIYIRGIPELEDHRVFNAIYAEDTAIVVTSRHI